MFKTADQSDGTSIHITNEQKAEIKIFFPDAFLENGELDLGRLRQALVASARSSCLAVGRQLSFASTPENQTISVNPRFADHPDEAGGDFERMANLFTGVGLKELADLAFQLSYEIDKATMNLVNAWGNTPFNGDARRTEVFKKICEEIRFAAIIETGTFRGATTLLLSSIGKCNVYTCEVNKRYFLYAQDILKNAPHTQLRMCDSRVLLKDLAKDDSITKKETFFYLDAHWYGDLPVLEELQIVTQNYKAPVVMIDDFEVPTDGAFKFDDYGPTGIISTDLILPALTDDYELLYPNWQLDPTGPSSRGFVIIARREYAQRLARVCPQLKRMSPVDAVIAQISRYRDTLKKISPDLGNLDTLIKEASQAAKENPGLKSEIERLSAEIRNNPDLKLEIEQLAAKISRLLKDKKTLTMALQGSQAELSQVQEIIKSRSHGWLHKLDNFIKESAKLPHQIKGVIKKLGKKKKRQDAQEHSLRSPDIHVGPLKFISHDGGFFSNFNFLIGEMYLGRRVYPLFSRPEMMKHYKELKHFAYLSPDIDNSWFSFFKPIEYFPGDNLHLDTTKLASLHNTLGGLAGWEFRIPAFSEALYDREDFADWRWSVHNRVAGLIHVSDEIDAKIKELVGRMPAYRIGVHVRHPSHLVEQGKIFFSDYFAVIDESLKKHPEAGIFLATDNDLAVIVFKRRYGDKLFYYNDFIRQSVDDVMEWAYTLFNGKSDDMGFVGGVGFQTHYKLAAAGGGEAGIRNGKEAVTDVFTLVQCDEFVCTISNFTLTCAFMNPRQIQRLVSGGVPVLKG